LTRFAVTPGAHVGTVHASPFKVFRARFGHGRCPRDKEGMRGQQKPMKTHAEDEELKRPRAMAEGAMPSGPSGL
jgi:hypothetical protein